MKTGSTAIKVKAFFSFGRIVDEAFDKLPISDRATSASYSLSITSTPINASLFPIWCLINSLVCKSGSWKTLRIFLTARSNTCTYIAPSISYTSPILTPLSRALDTEYPAFSACVFPVPLAPTNTLSPSPNSNSASAKTVKLRRCRRFNMGRSYVKSPAYRAARGAF